MHLICVGNGAGCTEKEDVHDKSKRDHRDGGRDEQRPVPLEKLHVPQQRQHRGADVPFVVSGSKRSERAAQCTQPIGKWCAHKHKEELRTYSASMLLGGAPKEE